MSKMKSTDARLFLENCRSTLKATTEGGYCGAGGDVVFIEVSQNGKASAFGLNDVYIDALVDFLTYVRNRKRPRKPIRIADPNVVDNDHC